MKAKIKETGEIKEFSASISIGEEIEIDLKTLYVPVGTIIKNFNPDSKY